MSELRASSAWTTTAGGASHLSGASARRTIVDEPELQPLAGSMKVVGLQKVVTNVLERMHGEMSMLMSQASAMSDESERKKALMLQLHSMRQQLIRLVVLLKWSKKAAAISELNKVLEKASSHSRALQSAADEAYSSHAERATRFAPLFDVNTALEVLETGSYRGLPSEIESLVPTPPLDEEDKRLKLAHITHLIHSELLKVRLPPTVEIASIADGILVLTAPRLYESKLTLTPVLPVPDAPSIKAKLNQGQINPEELDVSSSVSAAASSGQDQRWQWLLLDIKLLVSCSVRPPLHWSQVNYLLQDLNYRMSLASDSAVYRKMEEELSLRQQEGEGRDVEMKCEISAGPSHPAPSSAPSGLGSKSFAPTSSGHPTTSRLGISSPGLKKGLHLDLKLKELEVVANDERSAPLMVAHLVISDIAMRLFVDACVTVSRELVAAGGPWGEGHGKVLGQGKILKPGMRLAYWTQVVPLVPLPDDYPAAGAEGGGAGVRVGSKRKEREEEEGELSEEGSGRYVIEVGVDAVRGSIAARHYPPLPPLPAPPSINLDACWMDSEGGSKDGEGGREGGGSHLPHFLDVLLNPESVNIDELILRATMRLCARDLMALREELAGALQHLSVNACSIELSSTKLHWVKHSCRPALAERRAFVASMASSSVPPSDLESKASITLSWPLLKVRYSQSLMGKDPVILSISRDPITGRLTLHLPHKDEMHGIPSDPDLTTVLRDAEEDIHRAMIETKKAKLVVIQPMEVACQGLARVISDQLRYASAAVAFRSLSDSHGLPMKSLGASGLTKRFLNSEGVRRLLGEDKVASLTRSSYWGPLASLDLFPRAQTAPVPEAASLRPPLRGTRALTFFLSADPPPHPPSHHLLICTCNELGITTRLIRILPIPSTALGSDSDILAWCSTRIKWELFMVQLALLGVTFVEAIGGGQRLRISIESLPPSISGTKQHLPIPYVSADSNGSRAGITSIEIEYRMAPGAGQGAGNDPTFVVEMLGRLPSCPVLPSLSYPMSKANNAALELARDLTRILNNGS